MAALDTQERLQAEYERIGKFMLRGAAHPEDVPTPPEVLEFEGRTRRRQEVSAAPHFVPPTTTTATSTTTTTNTPPTDAPRTSVTTRAGAARAGVDGEATTIHTEASGASPSPSPEND